MDQDTGTDSQGTQWLATTCQACFQAAAKLAPVGRAGQARPRAPCHIPVIPLLIPLGFHTPCHASTAYGSPLCSHGC